MQSNKKLYLREELEQMPREQLEELLHAELALEDSDGELVRTILYILEERKRVPAEDAAAWAKYKAYVEAECRKVKKRQRRRGLLKLGAVAAVLILLVISVPQVAGAGNLVDFIKVVKDDVIAFFNPAQPDNRVEYAYRTSHAGLQQIYDAVRAAGITEPVVPSWVPEEYVLVEIKTEVYPSKTRVVASLAAAEKEVVFIYDFYGVAATHEIYRDEEPERIYEHSGVVHKKHMNHERILVLWERTGLECVLTADCQEEILDRILKSIYVMEDT